MLEDNREEIKLHLTIPEYERFTRIFQDSKCPSHQTFVMQAVDFVDRMRAAKEKVGCSKNLATLLVRNPKNNTEYVLEKF